MMTIAQCKAARHKMQHDPRYKPKRGSRGIKRGLALQRKIMLAGGGMRSIGYHKKK